MARVVLEIQVFIGSPADVREDRDAIKRLLGEIGSRSRRVVFRSFDFLDVPGAPGKPQEVIDYDIHKSDLVIILVGFRIGEGTHHELVQAIERARAGRLGHLMVYFRRMPPEMVEDPGPQAARVIDVRERIGDAVLFHEYSDTEHLSQIADRHISGWLAAREGAMRLLTPRAPNHDENIIATMRVRDALVVDPDQPRPDFEVDLARSPGEAEERTLERYVTGDLPCPSPHESHLIARMLFRRVLDSDSSACEEQQFVFPVHQHLRTIVQRAPFDDRERFEANLADWLSSPNVGETARNFAAFELGMNRVSGAAGALLDRLRDEAESRAVRNYAAMALGMIRDPLHTESMLDALAEIEDPFLQRTVEHAILFTEGVVGAR